MSTYYSKYIANIIYGSYEIGDRPTIFSNEITGNESLAATAIHEESHKDLFTNTYYGYTLRRVLDLKELSKSDKEYYSEVADFLISNSFEIAEGLSTTRELLFWAGKGRSLNDLIAKMPDDYMNAAQPYINVVAKLQSYGIRNLFDLAFIVDLIAECVLDYCFISFKGELNNFGDLLKVVLNGHPGDVVLRDVCKIVMMMPPDRFMSWQFSKNATAMTVQEIRRIAGIGKQSLFQDFPVFINLPVLLDSFRLENIANINKGIQANYPSLIFNPEIAEGVTSKVVHESNTHDFPILKFESTSEYLSCFVDRFKSVDKPMRFVTLLQKRVDTKVYDMISMLSREINNTIDFHPESYHLAGCTEAELQETDTHFSIIIWFFVVMLLNDGTIYNLDKIVKLQQLVVAYCDQISDEVFEVITSSFEENPICSLYTLPNNEQVGILAIEFNEARFILFQDVVVEITANEFNGLPVARKQLIDNTELAIAYMFYRRTNGIGNKL